MDITKQSHHSQQVLCSTRPCYRQGKKLTAVKVYTVSDESRHLLISKVPAIKLQAELCALCNRFGDVTSCSTVPQYDDEDTFVETYHIQYSRIQSSRFAKKQLDGRSFFGGVLHVCYAPELETVNETREKLVQRRKEVAVRIKKKCNPGEIAHTKRSCSFTGSNESTILPAQTVTKHEMAYSYSQTDPLPTFKENSSSENVMETTTSSCSIVPEQHTASLPKPSSVSSGTLKFIPRSVTVSKRVVFHKK